MHARRVVIIVFIAGSIGFAGYLGLLYGQLKQAFNRQDQFVPTQIYSDVSRIAPPHTRGSIEARLKALAYTTKKEADLVQFTLHPIDYPTYLVPDTYADLISHLQSESAGPAVTLHFSGTEPEAALSSIEVGGKETPELYLEPEVVATLSRSGAPGEKKEIRELVKFADIPAPVWQAIISVEDPRFLEHKGLDPRGIARAIFVDITRFRLAQGGSTLTMQLVKNLMERRNKNFIKKINELFLALLLEATFDKEQILERYLNEVPLGQVGNYEVHGVAEGARHFFGKNLTELNLAETALMAGLIRGPGFYSPYRHHERAIEREHFVLKKMVDNGHIAEGEMKAALQMPIHLAPPQTAMNKAPFFTDFAKAELLRELKGKVSESELAESGFRVYTTLDVAMNAAAQRSVAEGITELEKLFKIAPEDARHRLEGALASVDPSTGAIRALVGGRSYALSNFNRILNMKRQVGSTFKPLVYLAAISKGADPSGVPYGPAHPIEDAPWTLVYDHGRQSWSPKNYEKENLGWISFRTALAHSINTSTARLAWEIGVPELVKTARSLGVESELPQVPSLALGVAELSPIELLRVYSTFANHGMQQPLSVIRSIVQEGATYKRETTTGKQVYDPGAIDLLTDMLQTVFIDGTAKAASHMGFDRPAAGKTGTTSDHRDAWFAGYTPQLATVVWVGADQYMRSEPETLDPKADPKAKKAKPVKILLTGANSALPIWVRFMKKSLEGEPPATFPESPLIVNLQVDKKSGFEANSDCPSVQVITEKFLKGQEPRRKACENLWPPSTPKTEGP